MANSVDTVRDRGISRQNGKVNCGRMLAAAYPDIADDGRDAALSGGHQQPGSQQGARALQVSSLLSRWLPTAGDHGREVIVQLDFVRANVIALPQTQPKMYKGYADPCRHKLQKIPLIITTHPHAKVLTPTPFITGCSRRFFTSSSTARAFEFSGRAGAGEISARS